MPPIPITSWPSQPSSAASGRRARSDHRRSVGTGAHGHHSRRWLRNHPAQTNDPAGAWPDHGIVGGVHADPIGHIESDGPAAPSDGVACDPRAWSRSACACHFRTGDASRARCRPRIWRSTTTAGIRLGAPMVPEARNLSCSAAAGVGIVHGLAGSAAVALLVLTTISRPGWAIGYLLVFGIGTIVGMMLITAAIALPVHLYAEAFCAFESRAGDSLRSDQPELWTILVLPDWNFRRVVHRASELDASLKHFAANCPR